MTQKLSFKQEIIKLREALTIARQELKELESKRQQYDLQTGDTLRALESLRETVYGEHYSDTPKPHPGAIIDSLDVNPDSGRPSRGARQHQLDMICRKLGRGKKSFRTIEVLRTLETVEGELSEGMRSYVYGVMASFEKEGLIEKVGHGRWVLKG